MKKWITTITLFFVALLLLVHFQAFIMAVQLIGKVLLIIIILAVITAFVETIIDWFKTK